MGMGDSKEDTFSSWIVDYKLAKDSKFMILFVVRYNPLSEELTYVKSMVSPITSKVEVTEEFMSRVLQDTEVNRGARVFIRRVYPNDEDEMDAELMEKLSEVIMGGSIRDISDCHVLVIQEPGAGTDYDTFILPKLQVRRRRHCSDEQKSIPKIIVRWLSSEEQ